MSKANSSLDQLILTHHVVLQHCCRHGNGVGEWGNCCWAWDTDSRRWRGKGGNQDENNDYGDDDDDDDVDDDDDDDDGWHRCSQVRQSLETVLASWPRETTHGFLQHFTTRWFQLSTWSQWWQWHWWYSIMRMTVMRNIMTNHGFLRHLCLVIIIFSEVKILVVRISVILIRFYPFSPIEQHFQANECHQRVFNHRLYNSGQLMFFIQHCNILVP